MEVDKLLHMNGADHKISYAEYSGLQKIVIVASKPVLESSLRDLCKSKQLPKCINVADLGCSSGPNAFLAVEEIIGTVIRTCHEMNQQLPSIQVFLNDLVGNDFNSIFKSLPGFFDKVEESEDGGKTRSCFVAATPGSFYGRLFPQQSIHFVHSCFALHWLSQVPPGLVNEAGEQLNKRNICVTRTTYLPGVHAAYLDQFNKDFTLFLGLRSQELALSGQLVLAFICKNDEEDGCEYTELLGNTVEDMVKEGLIEGTKLETFNLPSYFPSTEEIQEAIETEGSFKLLLLDTFKWSFRKDNVVNGHVLKPQGGAHVAANLRAVYEPILASHFGASVMDDLFFRFGKKLSEYIEIGKGSLKSVLISLARK